MAAKRLEALASPWKTPRRYPRVRLLTQVEAQGGERTILGRAENISAGGMRILTAETLSPGTDVLVRFNLPPIPPGRLTEAKGVVVHAERGLYMGIQFRELTTDDVSAIEDYIRHANEKRGMRPTIVNGKK